MKKLITIISLVIPLIIPINVFADTTVGNEDNPPGNTIEVTTVEDDYISNGEYMPSSVTGKKFTGTGTVVDYSISEQKSFFVIETKDREIYYLIIDNEKQSDNAYFLREINESELRLDTSSQKEEIVIVQEVQPVKKDNSMFSTILIIIVVGGIGVYAYLNPQKVAKLFKKNIQNQNEEVYEEEIDDEDEELALLEEDLEEIEEE